MKKTNLILFFSLLTASLFFASCNQDELEVFTPNKNLTNAQIIQLIDEAEKITDRQQKATVTIQQNENSYRAEIDLIAKKALSQRYIKQEKGENLLVNLFYIEDGSSYEYDFDDNKKSYELRYVEDAFWFDIELSEIGYDDDFEEYEWKVSGNKLISTLSEKTEGEEYSLTIAITLDGNKRFKLIEFTVDSNKPENNLNYRASYEYTANPKLPKGFSKDQFIRVPEGLLHIEWGQPYGKMRYVSDDTDNNSFVFSISDDQAPTVAGKLPEFYEDAQFKNKITSVFYDIDDKKDWWLNYSFPVDIKEKTIYAKWIPASEAENSNKTAPQNITPRAKNNLWKKVK